MEHGIQPAMEPPQRRSSWPTAIGWVAVIFGAFGTLGALLGAVFHTFLEPIVHGMSELQKEVGQSPLDISLAQLEAMLPYRGQMVALSLVYLPVAALLLSAGIGLLRRLHWSSTASVSWAALKLLISAPAMLVNTKMQREMAEAISSAVEGTPQQALAEMMSVTGPPGMVVGILWISALPLFMLVWFSRTRIRQEVESWDSSRGGTDRER